MEQFFEPLGASWPSEHLLICANYQERYGSVKNQNDTGGCGKESTTKTQNVLWFWLANSPKVSELLLTAWSHT